MQGKLHEPDDLEEAFVALVCALDSEQLRSVMSKLDEDQCAKFVKVVAMLHDMRCGPCQKAQWN